MIDSVSRVGNKSKIIIDSVLGEGKKSIIIIDSGWEVVGTCGAGGCMGRGCEGAWAPWGALVGGMKPWVPGAEGVWRCPGEGGLRKYAYTCLL